MAGIFGTSNSETIAGTSGADAIDGGGGNDQLNGGARSDTYTYGAGSGNDTITEWAGDVGTDVVKLAGLNSSDLLFTSSGGDLLVQVNSTGETLKIERQFIDTNGIDQLVFADNSTWDRSQIQTAAWIRGT